MPIMAFRKSNAGFAGCSLFANLCRKMDDNIGLLLTVHMPDVIGLVRLFRKASNGDMLPSMSFQPDNKMLAENLARRLQDAFVQRSRAVQGSMFKVQG